MKKLLIMTAILLSVIPVNAQKTTERDNVINLITQYDNAIAKKDSIALNKILTDDFTGSIPNGQSFNKKSFITSLCGPQSRTREIKDESSKTWNIKISNDCAIVNRTVTYLVKTTGKEKPAEIKVKKLEVCLKIKGKWMIASVQGTEVLKN
jgi:hypothetical protein